MDNIVAYHQIGLVMALVGALVYLQLLVADIAGIRVKHVPGTPPKADHSQFHFRAARSLANMNESVVIFVLFALVGILSQADPLWLGRFAWGYLLARFAYMVCYWFGLKLARSSCFGLSLLALLGLGIVMAGGLMG